MHAVENDGLGGASGGISYDGKIAGLYDLEETLGSGHFAVVKLARHVFTGAKVAVKVVDKTKLDEVSKAHLFQEVRCMKLVQHPNVVRLYEVIDTQTKLYLVLEFGDGGDLYDYIMKHERGLNEDLSKKYFRQIVRAISYCHELHVVHRDLKPENVVFFEKQDVVKLTDFGFSNKFSPGQKLETSCGSLAYSAPEILLGDSYDAPAVDIWSLGVILYMLVCGQAPFEKANDSETLIMIMDCKYTIPPHITTECRNLIGSMLVRDPVKRATLEEISKNPWLQPSTICENIEYHIPLVSRQELSEEDHAFIIQKMINGKIASKEEITKSLDKNQYNHITATYFLLGEIRLRKHREEQIQKQYPQKCIPTSSKNHIMNFQFLNADTNLLTKDPIDRCSNSHVGDITHDKRIRKCSIVREEDENESLYEYSVDKYEVATRRESVSDGRLNESILDRTNSVVPKIVYNNPSSKMSVSVDADVTEQKLSRTEKHEGAIIVPISKTKCDVKFKVSTEPFVNEALCGIKGLKINRMRHLNTTSKNPVLTHRKVKLNKIRTPSCSSSETSDDDTRSGSKKKINKLVGDNPIRFRMHRRDSHDDSSDSQDQTTLPSSSASYIARCVNNSSSTNTKESKDEPQQDKEKNKTEYTRKPSNSHSKQKNHIREQQKQTQTDNSSFVTNIQGRCIRETQSIDRIIEVQEYQKHCPYTPFYNFPSTRIQQGNSMYNFYSLSFAKTKKAYNENQDLEKNCVLVNQNRAPKYQLEMNSNFDILKLNSLDEIDLVMYVTSFRKIIQIASYKCFATNKNIQ